MKLHTSSALLGAIFVSVIGLASAFQVGTGPVTCLTPEQEAVLDLLSVVQISDGQGGLVEALRVTSNLQVVNGLGATNGNPSNPDANDPFNTFTNGLGNLIVGYNELGNFMGDDRTGSHNIVTGFENSYKSFGGIIGGHEGEINSAYASVLGGQRNRAINKFSAVLGGNSNLASGEYSTISAGRFNEAMGSWSTVSGGGNSLSSLGNVAIGHYSSISGGSGNQSTGLQSHVCGGRFNDAIAGHGSVSGGNNRIVTNIDDWRAGTLLEDN